MTAATAKLPAAAALDASSGCLSRPAASEPATGQQLGSKQAAIRQQLGSMSTTQLYRESKLGDSLVDALDDLITDGKITPTLAMRILDQFDQARLVGS